MIDISRDDHTADRNEIIGGEGSDVGFVDTHKDNVSTVESEFYTNFYNEDSSRTQLENRAHGVLFSTAYGTLTQGGFDRPRSPLPEVKNQYWDGVFGLTKKD